MGKHKVVCYEKREQSEGSDRGSSREAMRPQQGSKDKIREAKRKKEGTVVGGKCWNSIGRSQKEAGPKGMFYNPRMRVHVYPKQS